jgi:carotenoid cleavage dioxygenase
VFVAAHPEAEENDGYLVSYVYDTDDDSSDLVILRADDPTAAPVAVVHLPQRVPFGFHGNWLVRTNT